MSWYTKPVGYIKPLGKTLGTGILAFGLATGLFACGDSSTVGPNGDEGVCVDCDSGYEDDADAYQSDNDDSGNLEDDDSSIDGGNDTENPLNPPDKIDTSKIKPPLDSEIVLGDSLEYGLIVPPGEDLVCRVSIIGPGVDKMLKEGSCNTSEFFGGNLDTGDGYQKGDYNLDFLVKNDAGSVDAERGFALVEESVGAPVFTGIIHDFSHCGVGYAMRFFLENTSDNMSYSVIEYSPNDFLTGDNNVTFTVRGPPQIPFGMLNAEPVLTAYGTLSFTLKACNGNECTQKAIVVESSRYDETISLNFGGKEYDLSFPNTQADRLFHGDPEHGLVDCQTGTEPSYDSEGNLVANIEGIQEDHITDPSQLSCLYQNATKLFIPNVQQIAEYVNNAESIPEILENYEASDLTLIKRIRVNSLPN